MAACDLHRVKLIGAVLFTTKNDNVNCRRDTLRVKQYNFIVLPSLFLKLSVTSLLFLWRDAIHNNLLH